MFLLEGKPTPTTGENNASESINNSENIQSEIQNESKPESKIESGIKNLFAEFSKPTAKDEFLKSNPEPTPTSTTGQTSQAATATTGTTGTPPQSIEPRKKANQMTIRFIDYLFTLICSIITDEARDRYKTADADLKELAEQLYDYEVSTGKKISSPLVDLLMTASVIYGEMAYKAVSDYRNKKATQIALEPENVFTGQENDTDKAKTAKVEKKKDGRGGFRANAGRKKGKK